MTFIPQLPKILKDGWDVLLLFIVPIGGGIPGGVLLAQAKGFAWPIMMLLYFISDVLLALFLEPFLKGFIYFTRNVPRLARAAEKTKMIIQKSVARYGYSTGPFTLVMISFGVDPMTGRAAAAASGHGFFSGWLLAITGDMFYFALIMICTLWLRSILGDGTWPTIIILVLTIGGPMLVKRIRNRFKKGVAI